MKTIRQNVTPGLAADCKAIPLSLNDLNYPYTHALRTKQNANGDHDSFLFAFENLAATGDT